MVADMSKTETDLETDPDTIPRDVGYRLAKNGAKPQSDDISDLWAKDPDKTYLYIGHTSRGDDVWEEEDCRGLNIFIVGHDTSFHPNVNGIWYKVQIHKGEVIKHYFRDDEPPFNLPFNLQCEVLSMLLEHHGEKGNTE